MIAYDDTYSVMEDGTVIITLTGRVKKPCKRGKYLYIQLHKPEHPTYYAGTLHRLVARLFHGEPPTGCVVDHIDRNPHNNHASNLRWTTTSENNVNRRITRPYSNNSTGYLHIQKVMRATGYKFLVFINRIGLRHVSTHATLEEAIAKRDEILAQAGV